MTAVERVHHEGVLAHCSALKVSAHFEWFWNEAVLKPMAEADAETKSRHGTAEARTEAMIEWNVFNDLVEFLKDREAVAKAAIDRA